MNELSIGQAFRADHTRLEHSLRDLTNAAQGASSSDLVVVWRSFEAGLQAHMEAEEESLLPLVRDPDVLGRLELDHAAIRRWFDDLGLAVELHTIRKERIDRFVAQLRAHAAREDEWLYGHADALLDRATRRTVLERLGALVDPRSTPKRDRQPRAT